eukprot:gene1553-48022_t
MGLQFGGGPAYGGAVGRGWVVRAMRKAAEKAVEAAAAP